MEIHFKLNEQEIKNIIAGHFKTSHNNVTLYQITPDDRRGDEYIIANVRYIVKDDECGTSTMD